MPTGLGQITEAGPPLLKILWPWEKAVTWDEEYISTRLEIASPCTDNPASVAPEVEGKPYLTAEPTYGELPPSLDMLAP